MFGMNRVSRSIRSEGEKKPFTRPSRGEIYRLLSFLRPYRGRMVLAIIA